MLEAGRCGTVGGDRRGQGRGRGRAAEGRGIELTCRARVSAVRMREGDLHGRRNSVEKAYSEKYAKGTRGPDGPMKDVVAC
jgi:hypothetical protein